MEPNFAANTAKINSFRAWCAARGWHTSAVALAWVLAQGDHLIPIPGTRKADNLHHWVQDIALTPQDLAEIEGILPVGFAEGDRYGDHQTMAIERYC